jgi:hypothetical protein
LLNPQQPVTGQRWDVGLNQGLKRDIAGFGHQHRTQADREVICTGLQLTDMRELVEKAGSRMNFEQDVRQLHQRQRA